MRRLCRWLNQLLCHHTWFVKSEPNRVFERCAACNLERPGWTIDERLMNRLVKSKRTATQDKRLLDMKRRWRA